MDVAEFALHLVSHDGVKGVGFTGSHRVGSLLARTASERTMPIPVYAEMGSVNPVFIFPNALAANGKTIAKGLTDSFTLGVGQFCTNPGVVFAIGSAKDIEAFIDDTATALSSIKLGKMLTEGIQSSFIRGVAEFGFHKGVHVEYSQPSTMEAAGANLFSVTAEEFIQNANNLQREIFGPSTLIVKVEDINLLHRIAAEMEGQLTASFHFTNEDSTTPILSIMMEKVAAKVGRVVANGFPTGVEVCHSMVHGGPWPASSDIRSTSVGSRAIFRWLRPQCFQNMPNELLPLELRDEHVAKVYRLDGGKWKFENQQ
jgi:NADP-dependent aldehyde dehydrogenase